MVFDGSETYTILAREQVSQVLLSRRDLKRQPLLADDQEGLTRRFHQAARRRVSVNDQAGSDLALAEELESERRAEAHELPGVSQGNWEDDHRPYWRS
jgi:hypothetical protein